MLGAFLSGKKRRRNLSLLLALALGVTLGWAHENALPKRKRVVMAIDVEAVTGSRLRVEVNRKVLGEIVCRSNERTTHLFENIPARIHHLSLELSEMTSRDFVVHGITFAQGGRQVGALTPDDLVRFQRRNVGLLHFANDHNSAVFRTLAGTARLEQAFDAKLAIGRAGPTWPTTKPAVFLIVLVGAGLVFVVLNRPRDRMLKDMAWGGLTVSVALGAAYGVSKLSMRLGDDPPSAARTAGQAAFLGFAPSTTQRAFILGFCATAVIGLLAGRSRSGTEPRKAETASRKDSRFSRVWAAGLVLVAAVATLPDSYALRAGLLEIPQPNDYDTQSVTTWQYMVWKGAVPFRDFWYPYGGQYVSTLPWPPGLVWNYVHHLIVTLVLGACLWKVLQRQIPWMGFFVLVSFWGVYTFAFQATHRYLLCIILILALALVLEGQKKWKWVSFAALAAYVAFYEWAQIFYALPGCLLLLGAKWWLHREERDHLLRSLGLSAAIFVAAVAFQIGLLWRSGQWQGYVTFVSTLRDQVAYSSQVVDLLSWFRPPRDRDGLVLLLTLALGALSVAFVSARGKEQRLVHFVPAALAAATATVFQKQLMRPGIASQILALPLLAFFLLTFFLNQRRPVRLGASLSVAAFAGYFLYTGYVDGGLGRHVLSTVRRAPFNAASVFHLNPTEMKFVRQNYFSPRRYQVGDLSGIELQTWMARHAGANDEVFVLGDEPYVYIVLDRMPPPYVGLYNQSLRSSQEEQLAWLERYQPRFVLWRPNAALSDGVPEQVRVPLVFAYVVARYVPESEAGGFQLLRRRNPQEPPALAFFRRWFGDRVDLGFLPGESGARSGRNEEERGPTAVEFVVARSWHPLQGRRREIVFDFAAQSLTVEFKEREGIGTYFIRTDRLWFYSLAASNNILLRLRPAHELDLEVALETIPVAEDVLY